MLLTAEHRKRLEERGVDGVVDPLTKAKKLEDIQMPVVLKGDEDHVYDLEPLIDYFVLHVKTSGKTTVKHPSPGQGRSEGVRLCDIEALTGEGIDEENEERVKLVLSDFEADIEQFLLEEAGAPPSLTEMQVNAEVAEQQRQAVMPGEEWKRKAVVPPEGARAFLQRVETAYGANFKLEDADALLVAIGGSDDKQEVFAQLEQLLDDNAEINLISDYDHDRKTRAYILNPDADEVLRVQRREIAAQKLVSEWVGV
jgi:hypothetical protein